MKYKAFLFVEAKSEAEAEEKFCDMTLEDIKDSILIEETGLED